MIEITVQGVVRPDGSLDLPPLRSLPTGPVEVTLRPLPVDERPKESWWEYLQRARGELEAENHHFRTGEEIDTYIEDLRSGDERIEDVYRRMNSPTGGR